MVDLRGKRLVCHFVGYLKQQKGNRDERGPKVYYFRCAGALLLAASPRDKTAPHNGSHTIRRFLM